MFPQTFAIFKTNQRTWDWGGVIANVLHGNNLKQADGLVRISALRGAGWSLLPLGLAGASLLPLWRREPAPFCLDFEGSLEDECPDPNCVKLHSPGKIRNDVSSSKENEHLPGNLRQKPGEGSTNGTAQKSSRRLWRFFHVSVFRLRALKWFEVIIIFFCKL